MAKPNKPPQELLELIKKEGHISGQKAEQLAGKIYRQIELTVTKSSPFPDPDDYARYLEIDPGLTTLMKDMAKREQEHIHSLNTANLANEGRLRRRGQLYALIVYLASIVLAGAALFLEQPWISGVFGVIGVGGVVTSFLRKD